MKNLLDEIHDRSLWQVLGLYLASSWVVLQVVDTLESVVGLPTWVPKASFILLAIGLPIVMTTAFVQRGWGRRRAAAEGDDKPSGRAVFTWRNAVVGGLGAFALLGVGTAIWLTMRAAGIGPMATLVARGVLDERDQVILADFTNVTDDPTLSDVVTEALRVDLSQSQAVDLADPGFLGGALIRMERDSETPIDEQVALEIGRREGIKAVLTGNVARAGDGYLLTTTLVAPESGDVLLSHRESAGDAGDLLDAIDRLSRYVRERVGDPLRDLASAMPLAEVTTADLDALRAYSQAMRLPESEPERRIDLVEEAVERDSTFAMAWNALGTLLGNYGVEPGRAMEARTRAFRLRDKLPEQERSFVASMYYLGVTNEPRQAIPHMEAAIERRREPSGAINNLGEAYRNIGDLEAALELYERSMEVAGAGSPIPRMNIAQVRSTMGDVEGALAAADSLDVEAGDPFGDWHRAMAYGAVRRYEEAEPYARAALETITGAPFLLAQGSQWLGGIRAVRGGIDEATESWLAAGDGMSAGGQPIEVIRNRVAAHVMRHMAYEGSEVTELNAILDAYPMDPYDAVQRPYLEVAYAYALTGHPDRARDFVDAFEREVPENVQFGQRYMWNRVSGEIALAEADAAGAIVFFRRSASRPQELEPIVGLARAFDAAGERDSALVYYRRFFESPHWLSAFPHAVYLVGAFERAAEIEYEAGNRREAAALLSEYVALWADADADLQPRVQRARARLQEILDEIG